MSLANLLKLVPPPDGVLSPVNWERVEERLGLGLPLDYKAIIEHYGAGSFDDFLWLADPDSENIYVDLASVSNRSLDRLRESGHSSPYRIERPGKDLFAFGGTSNGDYCFWLVPEEATPDEWHVVVRDHAEPEWCNTHLTLGEFLYSVLSGSFVTDVFPEDFPADVPSFVPHRDAGKIGDWVANAT